MRAILPDEIQVVGLEEIGFHDEIPETMGTIEGNAIQKVDTVFNQLTCDCFAEDTGLEIDALNGEPGVHSARYAGSSRNAEANYRKVLNLMENQKDRSARFRTVIALRLKGQLSTMEGVVEGTILCEPRGFGGFGYDPIFQPLGYDKSFAELDVAEKKSHLPPGTSRQKTIGFSQISNVEIEDHQRAENDTRVAIECEKSQVHFGKIIGFYQSVLVQ